MSTGQCPGYWSQVMLAKLLLLFLLLVVATNSRQFLKAAQCDLFFNGLLQRGLLTSNSTKVMKYRKRSTANFLKKIFDYKLYVRSIKYLANYCPCVFFLLISTYSRLIIFLLSFSIFFYCHCQSQLHIVAFVLMKFFCSSLKSQLVFSGLDAPCSLLFSFLN